ncbi:MAG: polysaccharide biosynthesis/export family protein [Paludibacteraceae bacterium]|nr:polysaccharide biosynthesis/export family protein [Paludibacteraceae bacterium]
MMSSCYTHRVVGLLQDRKGLPQYEKTEYEQYKIHENDEIIYRLITMDETISKVMMTGQAASLSTNPITYRVYPDGTIELPFLEPIYVLGMTLDSARLTVQEKMREIIPDAEIKLSIYNKTFTVVGDIRSGVYPIYKEKLTIYQALAMTGELMNSGDHQHVRIIRPTYTTEPEVLEFDIRTNTIIESKYYYVYPNDVIYVARTKGSFYKVASYSAFLGLVTSSLSLLVSVINYTTLVP